MPSLHCWAGEEDTMTDEQRWREHAAREYAGGPSFGICMLPDGHAGPHEWTDPSAITVRFTDEEAADAE